MFHAKYLNSSSFGFLKEDFLNFYYIHIRNIYGPSPLEQGPFLTPGILFEQTW
jgi:hypothetical protein